MKLLEELSRVKSKTSLKGRTYRVESILALIILGKACNCNDIESIARFGNRLNKSQRMKLGFIDKVPKHGIIRYTLKLIDCDSLINILSTFCGTSDQGRIVDIDGKTMRGSKKQERNAHHMISAFVREQRMVIGQVQVENAGKEIAGCLELLDKLELKKDIIVCDAIFAQQEIVENIAKKDCLFMINVKGNQGNLEHAIKKAFSERRDNIRRHSQPLEKGHGRIEERAIEVMNMPWEYNCAWRHIKQIICIKRLRSKKIKGKWEDSNETAYLITNLTEEQVDAATILDLNRGHWSIENKLHWVRDKVFREDEHNLAESNSCNVISNIRSFMTHIIDKTYKNIKATREMFAHKITVALKTLALC